MNADYFRKIKIVIALSILVIVNFSVTDRCA